MQTTDTHTRLEVLEARLMELQIQTLQALTKDHEARIRVLEETGIKFNFLLYLTMGGGLVSLFNLFALAAILFQLSRP
jgi:hypothetical protein